MSESGSRHSFSTGTSGGDSSAGSNNSDAAALNALQSRGDEDESFNDLLDTSRRLDEGIFATILLLNKNRSGGDIRWVVLRVLLEFLQLFRVIFSTTNGAWSINTSIWAFKAIRWVLIRGLILSKGYAAYIKLFYALAVIILLSLALAAWLAIVLKKDDSTQSGWIAKLIGALQLLSFLVFTLCWITILDYMMFLFSCKWTAIPSGLAAVTHSEWGNSCLAMPHLAPMAFAVFVIIVYIAACLLMSIGDCDMNPMTRNVLATPSASVHLRVLACKMAVVVLSSCVNSCPKFKAVVLLLLILIAWWSLLSGAGYYGEWALHSWVGLMTGILATTLLATISVYTAHEDVATKAKLTWCLLYVIFPAVAAGVAVSLLRVRYMRRPLAALREAFADVDTVQEFKAVFCFKDTAQVEILSRAMRKWDEDGMPDPDAVAFGEFIIKCGQARFPNNPALLIALANIQVTVRKDGQASRTQLQLAIKAQPSLVQRYFIFATQDLTKRLKDENSGLDLSSYVEFQRNYRACVRAHKAVLLAQRAFWMALLHDTIQFKSLQRSFLVMNKAEARASSVYRKVLERYPTNGKLLKIFGRFLEYAKNDPWTANRYYQEATKLGTTESLLELASAARSGTDLVMSQILNGVDEREDGLCIINASGIIMACNKPLLAMWGYEKGELESKNVSCLMPQPFSGRHNGYLQRYLQTGEARIINSTRNVVGLTKQRFVFPVSITVLKISGTRDDAVFMGIARQPPPADASGATVRLWVVPGSGTVLAADAAFVDQFGVPPTELVGRCVSSLGPDMPGIDKLVADATALPPGAAVDGCIKGKTQFLHRFLPPVDVEITVDFGGTDQERLFIFNVQCVVDAGALMVVDRRGRIPFATTQLASLLGFPLRSLINMELANLIPAPYGQLHAGFLKNTIAVPTPTSCRAGAVVDLLRANGVKVPVTLHMTTHDDGERVQHVVRVSPSSEEVRLNRQRCVLRVGDGGIVMAVNPGAGKALFGFPPEALVGQPLSSFITVFRDYRSKHGAEMELLTALCMRSMDVASGADEAWRVGVTLPNAEEAASAQAAGSGSLAAALSRRDRERPALMNVRVLMHDADAGAARAGGADHAHAAGGEAAAQAAQAGEAAGAAVNSAHSAGAVTIEIMLWRADTVAAVVEVDPGMEVVRADLASGLLFGAGHRALMKKDFRRLVGLPPAATKADVLAAPAAKGAASAGAAQHGKKSGLKGGGTATKAGARHRLVTKHADGGELKLEMQAVTKPGGSNMLVVRLQLLEPTTGTLAPMLALLGAAVAPPVAAQLPGSGAGEAAAAEQTGQAGDEVGGEVEPEAPGRRAEAGKSGARRVAALDPRGAAGRSEEEASEEEASLQEEGAARARASPTKHRTAEWVRQASQLHRHSGDGGRGGSDDPGSNEEAGADGAGYARGRGSGRRLQNTKDSRQLAPKVGAKGSSHAAASPSRAGRSRREDEGSESAGDEEAAGQRARKGSQSKKAAYAEDAENGDEGRGGQRGARFAASIAGGGVGGESEIESASDASGPGGLQRAASGGWAGGASSGFGGRQRGDGASSASGSEGPDAVSSAVVGDGEELAADFRRAKRLKKLTRLFISSAAQGATTRFKHRTWLLLLAILSAHVAAFAVLVTQIEARYSNAHGTTVMARAADRFQLSVMRSNQLQKCGLPSAADWATCAPKVYAMYDAKLLENTLQLREWHQRLYLGAGTKLAAFADPRLYNYWTSTMLPETNWLDVGYGNTTLQEHHETLWSIGNKFIMCSFDVHQDAPLLGMNIANTAAWNYIVLNGPESIFKGYAWSLDTFVDYAWSSLGRLKIVLIVLLVLETLFVQLACMLMLATLVKAANAQHMKHFSTFLALPSATLRAMAARQMVVDDDGAMNGDDEELEGLELAGGAGGEVGGDAAPGGGGGGDKGAGKSVRMAVEDDGKGDDEKSIKAKAKEGALSKKGAIKPVKHLTLAQKANKVLFGWLDTKVKLNGKKLLPNSSVITRFMAPLLLWGCAVVIVFGVSFKDLGNLQDPLSSLNAAAHVTYRISRVRVMGSFLAYSFDPPDVQAELRRKLQVELDLLHSEYEALLYGGRIPPTNPDIKFDSVAPPATFISEQFAHLFFKTRECLRDDKSTCYPEGHKFHDVTHNGLDAMVGKYMDMYDAFSRLPDELAYANHTYYEYIQSVGGHDMVEGLYRAVNMFEEYTVQRFQSVRTLHVILLIISIAIIGGFVILLFRPYVRLLHDESKDIAGLLSQLPAEVAVEEIAKSIVIGAPPPKPEAVGGSSMGAPWTLAGAAGAKSMVPYGAMGMGPGAMGPPGFMSMGPNGVYMAAPPGGYMAGAPGGAMVVPPGADGAVAVHMAGGGTGSAATPRGWGGSYM